jgi:hypothetical protein
VPFDSGAWSWGDVEHRSTTHLGRACVVANGSAAVLADLSLAEGAIEIELCVGRERAFHGLVWRARDEENYESFFVRPHQVGNPDAVQYTPVFNGISSWQLYHGPGFWAPIAFPPDEWFRIRVVFQRARAEMYVGDLDTPTLVSELKAAVEPGRVGRPLYDGDDTYRSPLHLPLEEGANELAVAVSEDFGGWGCRRGPAAQGSL